MSQIDSAIAFAATAHAGQLRKYDNLPYIVHPIEVIELIYGVGVRDEDTLVAAVLHDVVEDTPVSNDTIRRQFGVVVASLVDELTDRFTSENYRHLNRVARKQMERNRIALTTPAAQTIKYADLISNTRSIVKHDPGFARVYLSEKESILAVARAGNYTLLAQAEEALRRGQALLVQHSLEKMK